MKKGVKIVAKIESEPMSLIIIELLLFWEPKLECLLHKFGGGRLQRGWGGVGWVRGLRWRMTKLGEGEQEQCRKRICTDKSGFI